MYVITDNLVEALHYNDSLSVVLLISRSALVTFVFDWYNKIRHENERS